MRKSRFTEEKIIAVLTEQERGTGTAEVCRNHGIGLNASGAVVLRRRAKRETLIGLAAKLSPCIVAMEACCGAHHLGQLFAAHGHDVRLMSPEYVRPYVKAQKNDDRDAEGIAEAATRPTMRFIELKSQEQLDMQTLHCSRDRLVGERTALINQLRAILLERGIVVPKDRGLLRSLQCLAAVSTPRRHLQKDTRAIYIEGFCTQVRGCKADFAATRQPILASAALPSALYRGTQFKQAVATANTGC